MENVRKEIKIELLKGKYQYKNRNNYLYGNQDKYIVMFAGPVSMNPVWDNIRSLIRTPNHRINTESRKAMSKLEMASSSGELLREGITHIIVYECF